MTFSRRFLLQFLCVRFFFFWCQNPARAVSCLLWEYKSMSKFTLTRFKNFAVVYALGGAPALLSVYRYFGVLSLVKGPTHGSVRDPFGRSVSHLSTEPPFVCTQCIEVLLQSHFCTGQQCSGSVVWGLIACSCVIRRSCCSGGFTPTIAVETTGAGGDSHSFAADIDAAGQWDRTIHFFTQRRTTHHVNGTGRAVRPNPSRLEPTL